MPCRATQDGRVMVESSDKTWSTGEGNGKPLQCSCLENPMNSMKRLSPSCLQFPAMRYNLSTLLRSCGFLLKCPTQPTWPGKLSLGVSSHPPFPSHGGSAQGSLSTLHTALFCFLSSPPCNGELLKGRVCLVCLFDS